ncbi:MAG: Gfo/Idh/MocA family oxidoreductase [Bacteroidales bacterium]|nr:Gfo/Idh/MocA family oxidoreductase [Bacteroidales bacterium]
MKRIIALLALAALAFSCCKKADEIGYTIKNNQIVYNTPARPADQQSMLGFAAEPIEHVRIGLVGLGDRGGGAVRRLPYVDDASIVALCDLYPERVERAQQMLDEMGFPRAIHEFSGPEGYKELCESEDIDLVYLAVPWQLHTPIAVYAMEHGKHVAIEVPAATSIKECWDLVNTSERTRKHCMMLENCCYDFFELTCLNMAQHGLFGEIVHVEGSYCHNLEPYWDNYQGDWRMTYNKDHHGDVYPTHGIGPVCQDLNIHRGDKMDVLVAMDTDAFAGQDKADERYGKGAVPKYANGDNTTTVIRTRKGKTILVEHSVVTPQPYSRMFQIQGTKGYANKYPNEEFNVPGLALGGAALEDVAYDNLDAEQYMTIEEQNALMEAYKYPFVSEIEDMARKVGGHGGMDFIMDYRLIYCLHHGLPLDQDVYDAAEWSSLVELTEVSINHGSMPVVMPDFTRGEWNKLDGIHFATAE